MKKIISTVLALTMISNIAFTAMAEEVVDVETTEAVIELADDNLPEEVSEDSSDIVTPEYEDAELFDSGDVVLKSSPDKIEKRVADIEDLAVQSFSPSTVKGNNFKLNINSTFADYETFSIEEEDGNKFIRMASEAFSYTSNPVSNIEFVPVEASEFTLSYRFRFSDMTSDWIDASIGGTKVNTMFMSRSLGMNFGWGEWNNYKNNLAGNKGNIEAYIARYEELYGTRPTSQEWYFHRDFEEGVWYTITYNVNLNSVADGGQCYDISIVSDDNASKPVDVYIEDVPFRSAEAASTSGGSLKIVMPHHDAKKAIEAFQMDIDDFVSYASPEEKFYFEVKGPETLSDGVNTITTDYSNFTGSNKTVKEYVVVSEDGIIKEIFENTFFANDEGKDTFEIVFNADDYSGEVTYDVYVLDAETGANLCVKAGEGGEAPADFVSTELGYNKVIANVNSSDTYNAGFVTVKNSDGDIVYMTDVDFSVKSSVEYAIPEGTPEGNYTFEVTVSNADGDAVTETADIEYKKDSYVLEQFNAADADMGALIAKFGKDMGLDLDGEYATKSSYMDMIIGELAPFGDVDAIRAAFAQAEEAASELNGDFTHTTVASSKSQINRKTVDFEKFPVGEYYSSVSKLEGVKVDVNYPDYFDSRIVEEDGNKFYQLSQVGGFTVANGKKTAGTMTYTPADNIPSTYKAKLSYKIRFDTLSSGWHVLNIGGNLASLYVSSKKFGINYGSGHASGLSQHIFSDVVSQGKWYTVDLDVNFASQDFVLDIYDEDGNLFASTTSVRARCPFRGSTKNLDIYISPSEGGNCVLSIDDMSAVAYDPSSAPVAYVAEGTKDFMPGSNVVTVKFENLENTSKDAKVYIPVYANGVLADFVVAPVKIKAGTTVAEIPVEVDAEYFKNGGIVSYDVFVLEKLGGFNYTPISAVAETGNMSAVIKADFDNKKLDFSAVSNLDNSVVVVLAPGKTLADAEADPVSSIIYMAETTNGNPTGAIVVDDNLKAGEYTLVVSGQNANGDVVSDTSSAYYCGNDMVDTMIADFNAITDANAEATITKYITEYPVLSSSDENFASYYEANKDLLNSLAVSGKPYEKVSDIIEAFYTAYAIDEMKASETLERFAEVFEANASIYDIDVLSAEYQANKDAILEKLFASKADITIDSIKAMYEDALIVAEFNTITVANGKALIEKYGSKLGLKLDTEYAKYPDLVIREFIKKAPYATKAEIKNDFNQTVADIAALGGDYTKTVVKQSDAQEYPYAIDFSDAVVGDNGDLGLKGISYEINDASVGSVEIAEEDGNKYLALKQEDGYVAGSDEHAVGAVYKSSQIVDNWSGVIKEAKIGFSYKVKMEGIGTAGWTYLQINNLSSLYVTSSRKFGLNGSGTQSGSFADISVQDNAWYTIDYVMDFNAKTYDVTVTDESGKSQTITGRTFRGTANDIVFCPWTDQHKNNGAKSYVYVDDIKATVMAGNALVYNVTATKDLLPGENTFTIDFNNTNDFEEMPYVYIPVYVDGVLKEVVSDRFVVGAEAKTTEEIVVDIDSSLLRNNNVTYEILVMSEIGGFNYTPTCTVVPKTTGENPEKVDLTADFGIDFDKKMFDITVNSECLDNLAVTIIAPDREVYEASEDADKYVVYMSENDGGRVINDERKKPTAKREFKTSVAIDDKFGSGMYTLVVTAQDYEMNPWYAEAKVYYSGNEVADDFVADFNNATDANIESVITKYLGEYPIIASMDNRFAGYYAENKAVLNTICVSGKPYSKPSEIINTVFSAFYADEFNATESKEAFAESFEANCRYFDIDLSIKNYDENKEEVIDRLYDDKDDITATNMQAMYEEALMIARFNSAGATNVESVLNDYNEVLDLDFDKSEFSESEYLAFRKELTKAGQTFDSKEDILRAYDDALEAADKAGSSSSGGSGGGGGSSKPNKVVGGGGSTGGIGGNVSVALDKPYVESQVQLAEAKTGFKDLEGVEWAVESISELKKLGVVNGVDATHFNPNANVTREEFAKMIVSAFKVEASGKTFSDAPDGAWYTPYVNALASAGIADGTGYGNFGVGQTITRQDAVVILDRAAQYAKVNYEWDVSALYIFTDYVADYAKESVQKLYQAGVINGTSATTFSSTATLTRAQAAKMIYYMMQLGNK